AGHVSEKVFNEVQPLWKAAFHEAQAPLAAVQKASLAQRHALIEEAQALSAEPHLRIDAVKTLQQRWQQESQVVALDRRQEQKLWDAFRKPIDEAFQRKTQQREQAAAALSALDQAVIQAAKALETATQRGDAAQIRAAMQALEQATRGQAAAAAAASSAQAAAVSRAPAPAATEAAGESALPPAASDAQALTPAEPTSSEAALAPDAENPSTQAHSDVPAPLDEAAAATGTAADAETSATTAPETTAAAATQPTVAKKPVVAVRGDDRPGQKRTEPVTGRDGRGARPGERGRPGGPGGRDSRDARGPRDGARGFDRRDGREGRDGVDARGPRLGDTAFRAQRNALEQAQQTLRKLAAQAHGEALTQLLTAWEQRQADQVPPLKELGSRLQAPQRQAWVQAVSQAPSGDATEALLRLEIAADVPTPAAHVPARRALQLQMLTRRNDPAPAQTWAQDAARVLSANYDTDQARRLQSALKGLLKTP
ncbi:MAG: hypothetical protein RL509_1874, partial [Pseudomonadota bacterium]